MLNPVFSLEVEREFGASYVLPPDIQREAIRGNEASDVGVERRLQPVFGDELWQRLDALVPNHRWEGTDVLDVCAGAGYLSHHLLQRVSPRRLVLADISETSLAKARSLVTNGASETAVELLATDVTALPLPDQSFDVVIGNSFLHHFYDVPRALRELMRLLRPGGVMIALHEPLPAALALESSALAPLAQYMRHGDRWIDAIRHSGPGRFTSSLEDIWVFRPQDVEHLLADAGFTDVRIRQGNLVRPLVVGLARLHLTAGHERLRPREVRLLRFALAVDGALGRFVPARWMGDCSFVGARPLS